MIEPRKEDGKLDVKAMVQMNEKRFKHGKHEIPYMFFPCSGKPASRKLFISFGAWGGGYNRVRGYYEALRPTHDLLYLQDNHGPEKKGLWYLAENAVFSLEEAYTALIKSFIDRFPYEKQDVWFLGSSMGGFAALHFAYRLNLGRVVAICPLMAIRNLYKGQSPLYGYIMGESDLNVDEYIFRNFDRNVFTESHLLFCKDDDKLVRGQMGELLKLFINNKNKFTVRSYDILHPEGVSKHNVGFSILDRNGILRLFDSSLITDYVLDND